MNHNYLLEIESMANQYHVMRHGNSLANQQKMIVSDLVNARDAYGLSQLGFQQVETSMAHDHGLDSNTVIISSDFKRARETAEMVHQKLKCNTPLLFHPSLRERHFGDLELGPDDAYEKVWAEDKANPDSRYQNAESINQVTNRVTQVITEVESERQNSNVLFVSHGDVLQLLQTAFLKRGPSLHRQLVPLQTAEIRQLKLGCSDSC